MVCRNSCTVSETISVKKIKKYIQKPPRAIQEMTWLNEEPSCMDESANAPMLAGANHDVMAFTSLDTRLIKRSRRTRAGGVCRHFITRQIQLLIWARHISPERVVQRLAFILSQRYWFALEDHWDFLRLFLWNQWHLGSRLSSCRIVDFRRSCYPNDNFNQDCWCVELISRE